MPEKTIFYKIMVYTQQDVYNKQRLCLPVFFHSHVMLSSYLLVGLVASVAQHASALERRHTAGVSGNHRFNSDQVRRLIFAVTNNVLDLEVGDALEGLTPSSEYLASLRRNAISKAKRQTTTDDAADVQEPLVTLGGRVYMTRVTLGSRIFSLVLETGSSDTWVAQAGLTCRDDYGNVVAVTNCRFGPLYNSSLSRSYKAYSPRQAFGVNYTSGEFLQGVLATELFGIGDVGAGYAPRQIINQTVGLVQNGYWQGDGTSSALMGLAYSRLASGSSSIGYEAVMFSL